MYFTSGNTRRKHAGHTPSRGRGGAIEEHEKRGPQQSSPPGTAPQISRGGDPTTQSQDYET